MGAPLRSMPPFLTGKQKPARVRRVSGVFRRVSAVYRIGRFCSVSRFMRFKPRFMRFGHDSNTKRVLNRFASLGLVLESYRDLNRTIHAILTTLAVPTFMLLNGGAPVEKIVGANPDEVRKRVDRFIHSTPSYKSMGYSEHEQ